MAEVKELIGKIRGHEATYMPEHVLAEVDGYWRAVLKHEALIESLRDHLDTLEVLRQQARDRKGPSETELAAATAAIRESVADLAPELLSILEQDIKRAHGHKPHDAVEFIAQGAENVVLHVTEGRPLAIVQ